ncbi:ABC-2 type transport system ATP-binding protein [Lachnospiraceae bacterium PF1-21]|uniref:ABC transporter ATP-binding protein n=1 Tax=Ohessyouella blattaphilus TaxID=2949333 RepID=A0ABT1EIE5_9FIRM|nr:ABC transporter ATP-binding protein [Ohessyouella blattaphilus]MCP1110470.1 ABC transporter ATP-binding protein [Ohessyouella blattaphilus]MCR8563864.1 ABC transporter ATP-binding protein [Ohessyouella blattaphilus]MDL2250371.1 ABC transporter ATP-binding protein [Lachnospiraceae bacterium OttesenSCG-928-J05]
MNMIEMQDITKKFGSFTALDGVNLSVGEGEIHGFIGPNGAGKTTTIRVLMGILKATSGTATIFGKDVWKDSVEIHKRIAYVPGDVNLWSNLTGGEVIDLFLRLRGDKNAKYPKDLIEQFDFDPRKKCRTYSKGNRQKVALVAAFASDADLYIFDEPTSGLDPLMESVFKEHVQKVTREGKSILLSSHILSEVEELCNQVSIIRQGKIIETGTLTELRHLTRTSITVTTKEPLLGLAQLPYVFDISTKGDGTNFSVDTEHLGEAIAYLNGKDILDLKCLPPSLEELFMSHYAEGGH